MTMASILAISGVFVSTASPVSYFGYTSSIPYYPIFISLMFAIFAILTSGSSMIRWLHTDRHWTQEVSSTSIFVMLIAYLNIISNSNKAATLSGPTSCQ
ncbi:hypothetical protein C8R48DRAFT_743216 [Suillus tomentosus]|nr:hypothetical protein C8R48DRAFT_743216 [Suillus tomentosus]